MKSAKTIGIAAYLAFLIERLSQALHIEPRPEPEQIRRYEGVVREVRLDVAYYPARTPKGFVLIPKDHYYAESEEILKRA